MNRLKKISANSVKPNERDIVNELFNTANDVVDAYAIINHDLNPYILKEYPAQAESEILQVFFEDGGLDMLRENLKDDGFDVSELDDAYLTKIINGYDHYTNRSLSDEWDDIFDSAMELS